MSPLLLSGIFKIGESLIDRFFPDPEKKSAAQLELLKMQQTGELAALAAETDLAKLQIATNVEEAKHARIFIAGWRPAVGWVCAAAFAYSYLLLPFLQFLVYAFGTEKLVEQMANLPTLDLAGMLPVLFGMLGLGSLRTAEKIKNSEGNR